ncbi:MAG: hypothetical protein JW807_13815 [Spirochaetes bacterium]|nr:hypothetical protein [Spirochaetota bacterium]
MVIIFLFAAIPGHDNARAADVQSVPLLFYHETSEEPRLRELQDEFDFDEYIDRGMTEFEQMALLKNWVYKNIKYALNFKDSDLRDTIGILRRARRGDPFICTTMSTAFMQCAVSMGWTARQVFLKRPTGEEHAGNDIWSNHYRKWVYIDVTWNLHIERDGVPLSIQEIRREWLKNRGAHVVYVFGAGKKERRYTARQLPIVRRDSRVWKLIPVDRSWLGYFNRIAVLGRNDFFTCCCPKGPGARKPMYVVRNTAGRGRYAGSFVPGGIIHPPSRLFHDLNRVDVALESRGGKRRARRAKSVEVRLNAFGRYNYTPNFMEYLVKINDGDWKVTGERFRWDLQPGTNILKARIMNRLGIVGPVTEKRIVMPMEKKRGPDPRFRRKGREIAEIINSSRD